MWFDAVALQTGVYIPSFDNGRGRVLAGVLASIVGVFAYRRYAKSCSTAPVSFADGLAILAILIVPVFWTISSWAAGGS